MNAQAAIPHYQRIKDDLLARIAAGEWAVGESIPPEETLAKTFGVARMTVNRALRELTQEGHLTRTRGAGTFVAPPRVEATLLEIRDIADEIAERGHRHAAQVLLVEETKSDAATARALGLPPGSPVFHSTLVHCENEIPIQIEERWVTPAHAPDYPRQDFTRQTPSAYLSQVAPLTGASFTVEARPLPRALASALASPPDTPALVVRRITRSAKGIVSLALLWHPGERYRLTGRVGAG